MPIFRDLAASRDELDISFVMIGLNHPRDLIKVTASSGFNVSGMHIALKDFDPDDSRAVEAWAEGYSAKTEEDRIAIAHSILTATGGQPYLTANLCSKWHARRG